MWRCFVRWSAGGADRSGWRIARRVTRKRPNPSGEARDNPGHDGNGPGYRWRCSLPDDRRGGRRRRGKGTYRGCRTWAADSPDRHAGLPVRGAAQMVAPPGALRRGSRRGKSAGRSTLSAIWARSCGTDTACDCSTYGPRIGESQGAGQWRIQRQLQGTRLSRKKRSGAASRALVIVASNPATLAPRLVNTSQFVVGSASVYSTV